MQFIDLNRQYEALKVEINAAIKEVLQDSNFIMGRQITQLEIELANYVNRKHCVTCASGTDALVLAMKAYGLKKGDAVFVPTYSFFSTAEAVSRLEATPVFIDIELSTYNICPKSLERAVRETANQGRLIPRAIIAVDLFGLPFRYDQIKSIADKYNLLLIEDGAQGFGGSIYNKKACSFGDISITSFFPAKPLGCYGDGGAIFTDEDNVAAYIRSYKNHGKGADKYDNILIGTNSRLDTLQAAILLVKLKAFKEFELSARQEVAALYNRYLKEKVGVPYIPEGFTSAYAQYSILLPDENIRNITLEALGEKKIPVMIYYKKNLHQQIAYRNNYATFYHFPNAEMASQQILNLPMHPYLKKEEIEQICHTITEKKG